MKRCLPFGRKTMTNLDGILKRRDVTLPTKVHIVKAMVFPVVIYGCAAAAKLIQSCPTLCDSTDCSLPDSSVHGFSRQEGWSGVPLPSVIWMWELDNKKGWVLKNWCFLIVVLEKTFEGPLDCKEVKQINPKGNQSWIFIGRTDAEAEAPVLWSPDVKNWLNGKDHDTGKDWRQ